MNTFKVQAINRHRMLVDGEGVTTLVGLYGCPLKCSYCINKNVLSKKTFQNMTPKELLETVMVDYCYFISTGGGVTFGGGESLLYSEAILEFIRIRPQGLNVYMETSLNLETPFFEEIIEKVDYFIIDIKSFDDEIYKAYTGISAKTMKEHLQKICEKGLQEKCLIRVPIIPDYKTEDMAKQEAEEIRALGFSQIDLFPYILRDYMKEEA